MKGSRCIVIFCLLLLGAAGLAHAASRYGGNTPPSIAAVSVKTFGAVGDGVVRDDPAFLAATASVASNGGGVIFVPPGRYALYAAISLPSNVSIAGSGRASILVQKYNGTILRVTDASDINVSSLAIEGDRDKYPGSGDNGIEIDWSAAGGKNILLRDISISELSGAGIIAIGGRERPSRNLVIDGCAILDTGAHGIVVQDYISEVKIENNSVRNYGLGSPSRPGITASRNGRRVLISGNIVDGSADALGSSVHGISLDGCADVVCVDNRISVRAKGYGIEIGFVIGGAILNNTIDDCPHGPAIGISGNGRFLNGYSDGIAIVGNVVTSAAVGIQALMDNYTGKSRHSHVTIADNIISGKSVGVGIQAEYVDFIDIVSNTITNCSLSGIYLIDNTSQLIAENKITGCNVGLQRSVTSLDSNQAIATAVSPGHKFTTGDVINIVGALPPEYCGIFSIRVLDGNIFTYAISNAISSPAKGIVHAIKAADLGHAGLRVLSDDALYDNQTTLGENFIQNNGASDINIGLSHGANLGLGADVVVPKNR